MVSIIQKIGVYLAQDLPLLSFYCLDTKKKILSSREIDRKAKTEHINSFKMTNDRLGFWDKKIEFYIQDSYRE